MAKKSVASDRNAQGKIIDFAAAKAAPNFFSLNGKYQVAPGTTAVDLQNDIDCWLECAQEIVSTLAMELSDEGGSIASSPRTAARLLFGADHFLSMIIGARAAHHELESRHGSVA